VIKVLLLDSHAGFFTAGDQMFVGFAFSPSCFAFFNFNTSSGGTPKDNVRLFSFIFDIVEDTPPPLQIYTLRYLMITNMALVLLIFSRCLLTWAACKTDPFVLPITDIQVDPKFQTR
jgi:hypothetical protein